MSTEVQLHLNVAIDQSLIDNELYANDKEEIMRLLNAYIKYLWEAKKSK